MDYNGAQTADNTSDIGKLIEILNDWEFKYKEEKEASKKGTIPPTPKYADIIKTIGNIGLSVPMGFVMVHNDLTDIYTLLLDMYSSKGASVSSTSWQDVANTALNVAGDSVIAVTAMGLVSKIIDKYSLTEIIDNLERIIDISLGALPKATSAVMQSLEEIGSGVATTLLNISDLATDENIIAERKKNSLRYLNAFYSNLFTDLGYEAIFSDDGTEITGIKTYKDERAINLKEVFTGKITGEATDVAVETLGDVIGELATAKPKAWIDLAEDEIPQALISSFGVYDILSDKEIQSTISTMMNYYVKAFYGGQIAELGWIVDFDEGTLTKSTGFEQLWSVAKEAIGLYKSGGWTTVINAVTSAVSDSITQISTSWKSATNGNNADALTEAYGLYLKAYYANQIAGLGYEVDYEKGTVKKSDSVAFNSLFDLAKEVIGITKLGGVTTVVDAVTSSLSDSITKVSTSWKSATNGNNADALTEAYGLYLKAYYANQIAGLGYEVDYEKGTVKKSDSVAFESLFNLAKEVMGITKVGGVTTVIDAISSSLSDSITKVSTSWKSATSGENADALTEAYGLYLKAYYATQIAGLGYEVDYEKGTLTRKISWESIKSDVESIVGQVLTGGIGLGVEALAESASKAYSSLADAIGDEKAKKEIRSSVTQDLKEIIANNNISIDLLPYSTNLSSFATKFSEILLEQINDDKNKVYFQLSTGTLGIGNEIKELKSIVLDKFKNSSVDFLEEAFSKNYSDSVQSLVEEAVGNYTIEIKDATQTVSSYNESNLFSKLDDVLTKLTKIVNALTYEDISNSKSVSRLSALNTIDKTLSNGFDDLEISLDSIEGVIKSLSGSSVNEGNTTVDAMAQM